jgi:hypothetical protein
MEKEKNQFQKAGEKFAAVCGLYCEACSWFTSTTEDPARLIKLAEQRNWSVEDSKW